MATRKKTQTPALRKVAPVAKQQARKHVELLGDDTWVTAILIDADSRFNTTGTLLCQYQFEVRKPRLYAGRSLYWQVHEGLDKTIDNLAEQFPGIDFLDVESVWAALGGAAVRLHVFIDPAREDQHGNEYDARNRVASVYPVTERQAPAETTAEANAKVKAATAVLLDHMETGDTIDA